MIVLDASAVVDLLLRRSAAERIQKRIAASRESLHAPYLLDAEVLHVLRRYALRKQLSSARAQEALDDFENLRMTRYPHLPFSHRVWQLRNNLSVFDALYVALAEALDAPLLTGDAALARSPAHHARIELYS